ncbi:MULTISPECIES: nuclear transport factor 2 family protein [Frankia]|uniref:nuclear transport factor 2 family protein n=2 Tax=Frankiaceae TaxID=74712 RepID=UPI00031FFEA1|nr:MULTISPECIES: nuclear transport factor 2 family protein [Frankia]
MSDDVQDVATVLARVAQAHDDHRDEEWIAQYTSETTVWGALAEGPQAVRALLGLAPPAESHTVNFLSIPVIEIDGPVAHASTDSFTVHLDPAGGFSITSVVRLEDELVRDGAGRWTFARRLPTPLLPPAGRPAAEGSEGDGHE